MAAARGTRPPAAGKGRPKGAKNKVGGELKAMILGALDKSGGERYFVEQASKNPAAFMTLVGKVLPLQVSGEFRWESDFADRLVKARERASRLRAAEPTTEAKSDDRT
jgi:hypothetical protein